MMTKATTPTTKKQKTKKKKEAVKLLHHYFNKKGAGGGLLGLAKLKIAVPNKDKKSLKKFYQEDVVLRQYYGRPQPKKMAQRNAVSYFALDRCHLDLADFKDEYGSARYGLVAIDNFSRYLWVLPVDKKNVVAMKKVLGDLFKQMKVFQRYPCQSSCHYMSDFGLEFKSGQVVNFIKSRGHNITFLASSRSKAFYSGK
jgi:hypothetical protein